MSRPPSHFVRQLNAAAVERGSQAEILAELHQAIVDGRARPGSPIVIDEVARLFGVSPIPVREALKTLVADGLVTYGGRRGYRVAQLTAAEYEELHLVFRAFDLTAVPVAMARATPADHDRLRALVDAEQRAHDAGDFVAYHAASRELHDALLAPSGFHQIMALYNQTWDRIDSGLPLQYSPPPRRQHLIQEHRAILDAFVSGDVGALVDAIDAHYRVLHSAITSLDAAEFLFREA